MGKEFIAEEFIAGELLFILDPSRSPSAGGPGFYIYPDCHIKEEAKLDFNQRIFLQDSVHDVTPVIFLSYITEKRNKSSVDRNTTSRLCRIMIPIGKIGCIYDYCLYRNHEHEIPRTK
jgi:hypothetical protein